MGLPPQKRASTAANSRISNSTITGTSRASSCCAFAASPAATAASDDAGEDADASAESAVDSSADLAAEVDEMNARLRGWAFAVSEYTYGELTKGLESYLAEVEVDAETGVDAS